MKTKKQIIKRIDDLKKCYNSSGQARPFELGKLNYTIEALTWVLDD